MAFFIVLVAVILIAILGINLYTRTSQFGGKITSTHIQRYERSPNWKNGKFVNLESTVMNITPRTLPQILSKQFTNRKVREPETPLEIHAFDSAKFTSSSLAFVWYGHSVLLLRAGDSTFLIDPMFGPDASPIAPFAAKRFSANTLKLIDQLPPLDAILLTPDHYDHLDLESIRKLKAKCNTWFVSLGTGRHLERWGIQKVKEFDWWDEILHEDVRLTFTPSRHFSGRGTSDRAKSLWGGWVIEYADHKIYWSGDGGYGSHFEEVGKKFGPFDIGFMECGQYSEYWHQIHMYPEEAVRAAADAKVKIAIPVHWGGFNLSLHPWKEPVQRFAGEARNLNQQILTPELGKVIIPDSDSTGNWWDQYV